MGRQVISADILCISSLNENGYRSEYVLQISGKNWRKEDIQECLGIDRKEYLKKVQEYNGITKQAKKALSGAWEITSFQSLESAEKFIDEYLEDYVLMAYLAGI